MEGGACILCVSAVVFCGCMHMIRAPYGSAQTGYWKEVPASCVYQLLCSVAACI